MSRTRKIRIIEPQGRQGRPFNAWIRRWPLLGPVTLATLLDLAGFDAGVYNENISGPLDENPEALADVASADVIGISIMTPTAWRGYTLAKRLRAEAPEATIAFGGTHATFRPQEALDHGDVVVRGEGESVIEALARGDLRRGIVDAVPMADLDAIPALKYELMRDFDRLVAGSRRRELYQLPVATSRGCPYGCTYCSVTRMFGRRVRRQSVEKVCADLEAYVDQGFGHFFFYDDNFTADRAWTRELLERVGPLDIRFNAQARVDFPWADASRRTLDQPLLRAMQRAGGDVLYVGYETIDDATAAHWHKGYQGERDLKSRLQEDTRILHDTGFWVHGMFVLGPQHGQETADEIVHFARKMHLETLQISILTPFPGTPLFDEMHSDLVFTDFPRDWDFYDGSHCVYQGGQMSIAEMQMAVLDAHRRFYRWGGLQMERLRKVLRGGRMNLIDRLALLWANAQTARTTLKQWRAESDSFIDIARAKLAGLPLPEGAE